MILLTTLMWLASPGGEPSEPVLPAAVRASDDFEALLDEYEAAVAKWKTELREARKEGRTAEAKEKDPVYAYYDRFDALAQAGDGAAMVWLCKNVRDYLRKGYSIGERKEQTSSRKLAWYEALVRDHAKADCAEDIYSSLVLEKRWIGEDKVRELLLVFVDNTDDAELASSALMNVSGRIMRGEPSEEEKAHAQKLRDRILTDFPGTSAAEELEGIVFKEKHLSVGATAPDFTTEDVDGAEFKLSDYRGKVVLLDFWGFW